MIHVINGPNMNLLGKREPGLYGARTLSDLMSELATFAKKHKIEVDFFQSNHEGAILDYIQQLEPGTKIIINPGALAHTSIALRDCIIGTQVDAIEVHISNIFTREDFRQFSYLSGVCRGVISGLGTECYKMALLYFSER
ncbi:MAG: type II 3-dehydroquinate dehydratase [Candidatus Riflebacteria bacterium]|nr:type II 3-dehydroquinate dehydratase [Candidatus Riflebacteria bacterium]